MVSEGERRTAKIFGKQRAAHMFGRCDSAKTKIQKDETVLDC